MCQSTQTLNESTQTLRLERMFYCSYVHIIKTENHIVINITRKERIFSAAQKRDDTNHVGSCSMP